MKIERDVKVVLAVTLVALVGTAIILASYFNTNATENKSNSERYDDIQRHISDTVCPKCNGKMENGFLVDRGRARNYINTWVQGAPIAGNNGVNSDPGSLVVTMRCKACGYLESYAK